MFTQNTIAIVLSGLISRQRSFGYHHLGHLKRNISVVPGNLRSNFDEIAEQTAKRPMFYFPWKNQPSQKVAQVISQNKQPEPDPI